MLVMKSPLALGLCPLKKYYTASKDYVRLKLRGKDALCNSKTTTTTQIVKCLVLIQFIFLEFLFLFF